MPDLFKLLARNLVLGIVAGWITLALLIATNTGGLYDVVFGSVNPLLPIAILAFGFMITFGSLAMGAAIMLLPCGDCGGKDRGLKVHSLFASLKSRLPRFTDHQALVPVPAKDAVKPNRFIR